MQSGRDPVLGSGNLVKRGGSGRTGWRRMTGKEAKKRNKEEEKKL